MPPPPPPDERADARAKINPEFLQVDAALRAALVAAGITPAGHPRVNSTLAEDAGVITHHIARDIRIRACWWISRISTSTWTWNGSWSRRTAASRTRSWPRCRRPRLRGAGIVVGGEGLEPPTSSV